MKLSRLIHPSAQPVGHGITIGTPRFYDLLAALLFAGRRRRSYQELITAAEVERGDRVLDIGCGPGYFARMLAESVGPQGSVVGIDAAPEMIEYANGKARLVSHCRFESGAAESLAFPDASFDIVTSSLMMHHLPTQLQLHAVREMRRVVRPGGTLVLADFTVPERGAWQIVASLTGHAGGMARHMLSPVEALAAEAGFVDLRSGDSPPWLHYVRASAPI